MEVPQTYDELTEVLRAFKTEKGAASLWPCSTPYPFRTACCPAALVLWRAQQQRHGTNFSNSFYQEDGKVIYGATAEGTRKYLSWLHDLYTENLIDFENMQNRETNPFSDLNAGAAADGTNGYIFSNQPFGGNYSTMAAAQYGDATVTGGRYRMWQRKPVRQFLSMRKTLWWFHRRFCNFDLLSVRRRGGCPEIPGLWLQL